MVLGSSGIVLLWGKVKHPQNPWLSLRLGRKESAVSERYERPHGAAKKQGGRKWNNRRLLLYKTKKQGRAGGKKEGTSSEILVTLWQLEAGKESDRGKDISRRGGERGRKKNKNKKKKKRKKNNTQREEKEVRFSLDISKNKSRREGTKEKKIKRGNSISRKVSSRATGVKRQKSP